jgi:hypothetical protein
MCASTVDDRATRVFDEEAANAARLVGERVDDSQPASDGLGVRGVDCRGFTDVDAEARLRVLRLLGANDDLGRGVVGRLEVKHGIFHGHPHPKNLDVEVPRRRDFIPASVGDDPSHSHRKNIAGTTPATNGVRTVGARRAEEKRERWLATPRGHSDAEASSGSPPAARAVDLREYGKVG